jgi:hypothetical protein
MRFARRIRLTSNDGITLSDIYQLGTFKGHARFQQHYYLKPQYLLLTDRQQYRYGTQVGSTSLLPASQSVRTVKINHRV